MHAKRTPRKGERRLQPQLRLNLCCALNPAQGSALAASAFGDTLFLNRSPLCLLALGQFLSMHHGDTGAHSFSFVLPSCTDVGFLSMRRRTISVMLSAGKELLLEGPKIRPATARNVGYARANEEYHARSAGTGPTTGRDSEAAFPQNGNP